MELKDCINLTSEEILEVLDNHKDFILNSADRNEEEQTKDCDKLMSLAILAIINL